MLNINKISTKIILAIGAIWLPFVIVGVWFDMDQAKQLALHEVQRWGVTTGESVRVELNTLMREGKMDARFSLFNDLTNEISQLNSIRVIRSPRVNEIFRRVREERDIPREIDNISVNREEIVGLLKRFDRARNVDERNDIANDITNISYEINLSEEKIQKYRQLTAIDPRETAKDEIEDRVLKTGKPVVLVNEDKIRMVEPFKVRKAGCTEASGCHVYAKEGDVLGAINMVFSINDINREVRIHTITTVTAKVFVSVIILSLIYMAMNMIVIRNVNNLRHAMKKISKGDLGVRLSMRRRNTDKNISPVAISGGDDELDYLIDGFNAMALKLQEDQEKLEKLASCDGLTGLYNHRKFASSLKEELASYQHHSQPLSLLLIDLDNFKNINDTYGHQAGDEALRTVSMVVKTQTRLGDIAARYGGEEIAVILPQTSSDNAMELAERIRKEIEGRDVEYEPGKTLHLTASIGVSTLPTDAMTEDVLFQSADTALYTAKKDGRNRVRRGSRD